MSLQAVPTEYVVGFLFSRNSPRRVVLVQKARPPWQAGRLNGVGGKVEPGEAPLAAMRREFREETGRDVEDWEPYVVLEGDGWRVHFYRAFTGIALDATFGLAETDEPVRCVVVARLRDEPTLWNVQWLVPLALDEDVVAGVDRPVAVLRELPGAARAPVPAEGH